MKLALGSDHAGVQKKAFVKDWLIRNGHEAVDLGPYSEESCDYPDYARKVAQAVASGEVAQGVLLCGSGVGVSIVANKTKGVRAALAYQPEIASLARQHNNANVICFPARYMNESEIEQCLKNWFEADFEGGRHERRVSKIED
ncbi:sugar-phosphate isomerase, RpiB/LacA/LacB family [Chloroherpeton thalassium ATCC 35110]|uniref:Sugar-phosphate isomerase, RpiB/LacA/LacB family n=1 Tax=Chloroherpeton thalassium (strain ATCC 35110 / GB-78) TaxID=517418 RepID=B3QY86_CHLT3|nr:ribose 5-phosphate isomerase B [Chloroherpeton thalassium]ACF15052.1 sugar-phosphate isomerase, RpiB/LacA/LacB family [Chloroherpeton thalassium ATCC 35110]